MARNVYRHPNGLVHVYNSAKPGFDKFDFLSHSELQRDIAPIALTTQRSEAYKDAFALVFFLTEGQPVPALGDLRVTRSCIQHGILIYDQERNEISPGIGLPRIFATGPQRHAENGTTYQAVLEGSRTHGRAH